jgi:hypothetical protein
MRRIWGGEKAVSFRRNNMYKDIQLQNSITFLRLSKQFDSSGG